MDSPKDDLHHSDVVRAIEQGVSLHDYDPAWPAQFEAERARIRSIFPDTFVAIEHIGSTAVPGMQSKPLIDMLAGVRTMDEAFALNETIQRIGYTTSAAVNSTLATRQWFMRQSGGQRTHHLHVVVHGSEDWDARVGFRDRLRADPELRARYTALKADLVERFAEDRESYTEGKSAFIVDAVRTDPHRQVPMTTPYRLHCFAQSGNSYKVALMLELSGVPWTPLWVDFFNGGTRASDYRGLNVMAEAPVLECDGLVLAQSGMILDHLARTLKQFAPADDAEHREILRWTLWDNHKFTGYIATYRWMLQFAKPGTIDPAVVAFYKARSWSALKTLDAHLKDRAFVAADRPTIADLSLVGYLYFPTEFGLDWSAFPAVEAWTKRIAALPRWKHPYDLMPGHPLPRAAD